MPCSYHVQAQIDRQTDTGCQVVRRGGGRESFPRHGYVLCTRGASSVPPSVPRPRPRPRPRLRLLACQHAIRGFRLGQGLCMDRGSPRGCDQSEQLSGEMNPASPARWSALARWGRGRHWAGMALIVPQQAPLALARFEAGGKCGRRFLAGIWGKSLPSTPCPVTRYCTVLLPVCM